MTCKVSMFNDNKFKVKCCNKSEILKWINKNNKI